MQSSGRLLKMLTASEILFLYWLPEIIINNNMYMYLCLKFIYFERERKREWGEAEREGERENPKQAPNCQHGAQCGTRTHKL